MAYKPFRLICNSTQPLLCQGKPRLASLRLVLLVLHWTQWPPPPIFTADLSLTDWNRAKQKGEPDCLNMNNARKAMLHSTVPYCSLYYQPVQCTFTLFKECQKIKVLLKELGRSLCSCQGRMFTEWEGSEGVTSCVVLFVNLLLLLYIFFFN